MSARLRVPLAALLVLLAPAALPGVAADGGSVYEGWSHQLHDCRDDWGPDSSGTPEAPGHDLVSLDLREGPIPDAPGGGFGVRLTVEGGFDGEPPEDEKLVSLVNLTVRGEDGAEDVQVLFGTDDNERFTVRSRTFPDRVIHRTARDGEGFYVAAWFNHHRFGIGDGDVVEARHVTSYHLADGKVHERDTMAGGYTDPGTGQEVEGCPSPADTRRYEDADGYTVRETPGPPPVADFTIDGHTPEAGDEVRFLDRSSDANDTVEERRWYFGDGANATGTEPTHVYEEPGRYKVTLVVRDAEGNRNLTRKALEVEPGGPDASFEGGPQGPTPGQTVYLNSTAREPGENLTHAWSFGDGDTATGRNVTHRYREPGEYVITLEVTDGDGRTDTARARVHVVEPGGDGGGGEETGSGDDAGEDEEDPAPDRSRNRTGNTSQGNRPPDARLDGPARVPADEAAAFASRSGDPDGEVVTRTWMFGDGTTGSGARTNHTYDEPGAYNVTLTVVDDEGRRDEDTQEVRVVPPPAPAGSSGGAGNGTVGTADRSGPSGAVEARKGAPAASALLALAGTALAALARRRR